MTLTHVTPRARSSRRWLVLISVLAHAALAIGIFVSGVWNIERLEGTRAQRALGVLLIPGDPGGGGGEAAAPPKAAKPKAAPKTVVKTIVQPVPVKDEPTPTEAIATTDGAGTGSNTGIGDGEGPGTGPGEGPGSGGGGGQCTTNCEPAPTLPPVVTTPTIVPPSVLTGLRISGETQIVPSDPVKTDMLRDGKSRTTGAFKVCLDTRGQISSVTTIGSTKYADYDAKIVSAIRAWRYQPYRVNGTPAPACSMVTFVYTIR